MEGSMKIKLVFLILLGLIYSILMLSWHWRTFGITYPVTEYENRYSQSQYVLGEAKTHVLGDGDVYTFAGIRYMDGEDPTKINFEHPPLAKYFYGLSYILTGYPNFAHVPLMVLAIAAFGFIATDLYSTKAGVISAFLLFLAHSVTYKFFAQTLLDFPQMAVSLVLVAVYLALWRRPTMLKVMLWGLINGLFWAIKYPFPISLALSFMLFLWIYLRTMKIWWIISGLFAALIAYLSTYTAYFLSGHSLLDLIAFERYRLSWYRGKTTGPKGLLLQTIFKGKHAAWYETGNKHVVYEQWNLLWPVQFSLFWISLILSPLKKTHPLVPYFLWIILSTTVYLLGAEGDRFLTPLVPGFALGGGLLIERISLRYKASEKA